MEKIEIRQLPGISTEQIKSLVEIMGYFERIDKAALYGARVTGGCRKDSDLDVALYVSNRSNFSLSDIVDGLSVLTLGRLGLDPHYKVVEDVNNPDLLYKIENEGVVFYRRRWLT